MLSSSCAIVFAAGGLLLLGACTVNTAPAAAPAPVIVQERSPATLVTPGTVLVQPRY